MTDRDSNIYIGGFMGAGKSTVSKELSHLTGRPHIDLDQLIETREESKIEEIFRYRGESYFREAELHALSEVSKIKNTIVSLGGGTLIREENREVVRSGRLIVLDVELDTVQSRLAGSSNRPLLKGGSLKDLYESRRSIYKEGLQIKSDDKSPSEIAQEIKRELNLTEAHNPDEKILDHPVCKVITGSNILKDLSKFVSKPFVICDEITWSLFCDSKSPKKGRAILPRGEKAKTLGETRKIYGSLSSSGVDRYDTIVAVGGGCVGDPAGFAAATWMRGIDFIQCPTTLLAQIDSSLGGKTGVNLPEGKNLVGAFHQPKLVICDVDCLSTLSDKDYRQGLAELIKYGMGEDKDLLRWIEDKRDLILNRDRETLIEVVNRCASIKLDIVAEDEKESGARARLNLGHTVGHAIEASSNYNLQHGDSVAIGLVVITHIAWKEGLCDESDFIRVKELVASFGLPSKPKTAWNEIESHLKMDKKFKKGQLRLIVPTGKGKSVIRDDISLEDLRRSYEEVMR